MTAHKKRMSMDKFLIIAFPAITFAVIAAGIILFEIVKYMGHVFL